MNFWLEAIGQAILQWQDWFCGTYNCRERGDQ